jgi:hypothetical protein
MLTAAVVVSVLALVTSFWPKRRRDHEPRALMLCDAARTRNVSDADVAFDTLYRVILAPSVIKMPNHATHVYLPGDPEKQQR